MGIRACNHITVWCGVVCISRWTDALEVEGSWTSLWYISLIVSLNLSLILWRFIKQMTHSSSVRYGQYFHLFLFFMCSESTDFFVCLCCNYQYLVHPPHCYLRLIEHTKAGQNPHFDCSFIFQLNEINFSTKSQIKFKNHCCT